MYFACELDNFVFFAGREDSSESISIFFSSVEFVLSALLAASFEVVSVVVVFVSVDVVSVPLGFVSGFSKIMYGTVTVSG